MKPSAKMGHPATARRARGFARWPLFRVLRGFLLAHQLETLLDAEAMLLVDDDQPKVVEVHFLFDQSMRSDGEIGFAAQDPRTRLALRPLIQRASQQRHAIRRASPRRDDIREQFARRKIVLRVARISVGAIRAA